MDSGTSVTFYGSESRHGNGMVFFFLNRERMENNPSGMFTR